MKTLLAAAAVLLIVSAAAAVGTDAPIHAAAGVARAAVNAVELRAPARLSETGLWDEGNLPFSPQYPLWTDGAAKSRWIHLPPGTAIDGSDVRAWNFPTGTKLWKEFRFAGKKIETRLLWKATDTQWVVASYAWNAEQTEAELVPDEGLPRAAEVAPGRFHDIPSVNDCKACHGAKQTGPLGFNALQLSTDRDPGAIHAEPLAPGMITLRELVERRMLVGSRTDLLAHPPRIAADDPDTRVVLGYLTANCGTCHNTRGEITADIPSLSFADLMEDGAGVARRLFDHRTNWQLPGATERATQLVHAGDPQKSALFVRMRSRQPSTQMPPLGTVLRDEEAVAAVARWIATRVQPSH